MSATIMKNDGTPFETEKAAKMRAGVLAKDGKQTQVVPVEGGFALELVSEEPERKRVPLTKSNILTVSNRDPNYKYRIVNDGPRYEDRLQRFQDAGWEIDTTQGQIGDERVGDSKYPTSAKVKPVGGGIMGVVMRKKKDWFDEDYADKQKKNDVSEQSIMENAVQGRYGKMQVNKQTLHGEYK